MKKLVIFNVGGVLSCYAEFDEKKVIIDLGASLLFSPVDDFLIPLTKRKCFSICKVDKKGYIDCLHITSWDSNHCEKNLLKSF